WPWVASGLAVCTCLFRARLLAASGLPLGGLLFEALKLLLLLLRLGPVPVGPLLVVVGFECHFVTLRTARFALIAAAWEIGQSPEPAARFSDPQLPWRGEARAIAPSSAPWPHAHVPARA